MKQYLITVDGGTTNTRIMLWDIIHRTIVAQKKYGIGVRNTAMDGHNAMLKTAVRDGIADVLLQASLCEADLQAIVASGMLTSNVGLLEIPHIKVPASMTDLALAMVSADLPDICGLPIHFIPGMKNNCGAVSLANVESMDMMRGEETEICAVLDLLESHNPLLLVLPGSHTKFISVDEQGRVTGMLSSIAGELLMSITNHTVLADAVQHSFVQPDNYERELVLAGYITAKKVGLGRACFSTRIFNQFVSKEAAQAANFLLGAVLQGDVEAVRNSAALKVSDRTEVIVAGKEPLRTALTDILQYEQCFARVRGFEYAGDKPLAGLGALTLAKQRGLM